MNKNNKSISVCIAAYNDENTIEPIIKESIEVLRGLSSDFEIIVIDDCSQDRTGKILEGLKPVYPFLKPIIHKRNMGYGATIKELLYASCGELVFTLPGDFQIPPQAIGKMLPLIDNYDIIIGSRNPRNDPLLRKINSRIYNITVNLLFGIMITDINSSKLVRRKAIENIKLISNGPFIDAELCMKAVRQGFKIKEVAIEHRRRLFGQPSGDKPRVMWQAFKETLSMWAQDLIGR